MVLLLGASFQLCCFASLGVYLYGIDQMSDSGWSGCVQGWIEYVFNWTCNLCGYSLRQQISPAWMLKKEDGLVLPVDRVSVSDDFDGAAKPLLAAFAESQLEIFYHQQGLLLLHLIVMIMLIPSLVAWIQVGNRPIVFNLTEIYICR